MRWGRAILVAVAIAVAVPGCSMTYAPGTTPEVTAGRFAEALAQAEASKACNLMTYDGTRPLANDERHKQEYVECRKGMQDDPSGASAPAKVGKATIVAVQRDNGRANVAVKFPDAEDAAFRDGLMIPLVEIDERWYVDGTYFGASKRA